MMSFQNRLKLNASTHWQLKLQFMLLDFGWLRLALMGITCMALAGWWWGIPRMQKQVYRLEEQVVALKEKKIQKQALAKLPVLDANTARLNSFYELLGERQYVEQQVKTIFYLANETGIALKAGEYQLAENHAGQYFTYRVQLPVKANYQQLRKFIEQVLLTIPFASLDEISFKREMINGPTVDSKIVFTLFVAEDQAPGKGNLE